MGGDEGVSVGGAEPVDDLVGLGGKECDVRCRQKGAWGGTESGLDQLTTIQS